VKVRGKSILIVGAVLLAGMALAAISLRHRHEPARETPRAAGAVLPAGGSDLSLPGAVRPQHLTGVGAGLTGNIDAFLVEVGQEVYQGQVLARVGSGGMESAREAAAAAVERAQEQVIRCEGVVASAVLEASRADAAAQRSRIELERVEKLFARQKSLLAAGATPRLTYQKVERDYQAARADFEAVDKAARAAHAQVDDANSQLATAKKLTEDRNRELQDAQGALDATEVQSPVDGLVVGRAGEVGRPAAEAGADLFQVATDLYAMEVPLTAPAAVAGRIRPGQSAMVLILDLQGAGLPGAVKSVDGTQVVVEFESTLPTLRPGMRADVRLKLE
jgi:multidrug resistance efflux pump